MGRVVLSFCLAMLLGVALGITSRTRLCAEAGVEFEEVMEELAQEEALGFDDLAGAAAALGVVEPRDQVALGRGHQPLLDHRLVLDGAEKSLHAP